MQTKTGFSYELVSEPRGEIDAQLEVVELVRKQLPRMSKWRVEELGATIRRFYMLRYKKHKHNKYGSLNKGFTEKELQAFLLAVKEPKIKLLFEYQANLGLRIGEVVKVNIKDINFETRELLVRTEKAKTLDTLRIPLPLFKTTIEFIQDNKEQIAKNEGYIFFRQFERSSRKECWLEPNYTRNRFRYYLIKAGLDQTYDISDETGERTPRQLHRLTTHSLRHYAITRFAKNTNGNLILTSRFARHLSPQVTTTYINTDRKEIFDVIDSIAVSEVTLLKKQLGE